MIPFFSYGILLIVTHLHTSLTLLIILINFIDLRKTTLHKKILIGDIKQIHILMYVNSNLVNFTWFIRVMTVVMIAQKQLNSGYVFFFPCNQCCATLISRMSNKRISCFYIPILQHPETYCCLWTECKCIIL